MAAIPTINVQDGKGGFVVINAKDFDPAVHTVYSENGEATEKPKPARKPKV